MWLALGEMMEHYAQEEPEKELARRSTTRHGLPSLYKWINFTPQGDQEDQHGEKI